MQMGRFNEAIQSNFDSLVRSAEMVLHCEASVKDAVQIALSRVWKNIDRFDPKKAALKTLLYTAVNNAAKDVFTARKRRVAAMELYWGETLIKERRKKPDPRLDKLIQAIEQMPEDKKVVVEKFFFEGKRVEEIAEELGLSVSATKARLHRVRGSWFQHLPPVSRISI